MIAHSFCCEPASESVTPSQGPPMTDDQIGEIRKEFKPGLDNLIAGVIIGVLLVAGGCALIYLPLNGVIEAEGHLPWWVDKGWCWGAVALIGALGIGLIVGGVALILWMRSLVSFRVRVGQAGLSIAERKAERFVAWGDIVSIEETHLHERPPILKGVAKYALPKLTSRSYVLNLREGEPFGFDGNTVKGHNNLAEMIRAETDPRNIPWEIKDEQGY